jgi:hypothetical protein
MERMVKLYAAPSEYMALSLREALAAAGIPCLLFSNELPMEPGFNFGADAAYADVYVTEEDAVQAREIAQDVRGTLCAEDSGAETAYPRRINLRLPAGLGLFVYVCCSIILLPLFLPGRSYDLALQHGPPPSIDSLAVLPAFILFSALNLALLGTLLYANWELVKRLGLHLGLALLGVLALPLWLGYEALAWCARKLEALGAP